MTQLTAETGQSHGANPVFAPEFAALRKHLPEGPPRHPILLRYEAEAGWLVAHGVEPGLARAAAARAAAIFGMDEDGPADGSASPPWRAPMAADISPGPLRLAALFGLGADAAERLHEVWGLLGTADALMETGGDIRLTRDPKTALNGYGCSHRPRPWAITFASSTASSSSARGYIAADKARLAVTAALLRGALRAKAVDTCIEAARRGIAKGFGLRAGEEIVLAASGTDTELLALALTHLAGTDKPILNILIAPEETGRGVPMAARGLHFAVDTALGHDVTCEAPIEGFRRDTALANIPLRDASGVVRMAVVVEAEIEAALAGALAAGKRVILHGLDLSKTGLLAPSPMFLAKLRAVYGDAFDIVLDACQVRLSAASVRAYLDLGATVLVTGSKFFTGPPFAGAALLPAPVAARLQTGALPAGLAAYFNRAEFPVNAPAARDLPEGGNYGLALRWHAALAEMRAFLRVSPVRRAEILRGFAAAVERGISATPGLTLLPAPPLSRTSTEENWERLPSIFTFSLRAPHASGRCLAPVEARQVYMWLNTDLSAWMPEQPEIAARICHIGQPVPLAQPDGNGQMGALRVSAGARLISGEPSHRALGPRARLEREFTDVGVVFAKIGLILANWEALCAADPSPCYRSRGLSSSP
ncbi:MAG: hypothetical protein KGQ79_05800 [Proteobacteria bacterium]|nr:hypothetical protein [Pseudomonadota bacterium]MBU6425310.1 hypothetical protein [Rhodospirillales bacterium]